MGVDLDLDSTPTPTCLRPCDPTLSLAPRASLVRPFARSFVRSLARSPGWTFFSEPLSVVSVLGIVLIFAGILAISIETQDNINNNKKNGRTDESAEMALLLPTLSTKASGDPTTASTTTR